MSGRQHPSRKRRGYTPPPKRHPAPYRQRSTPRRWKVAIVGDSHVERLIRYVLTLMPLILGNIEYRAYGKGGLRLEDAWWYLICSTDIYDYNPDIVIVHCGACNLLPKTLDETPMRRPMFERLLRQVFTVFQVQYSYFTA